MCLFHSKIKYRIVCDSTEPQNWPDHPLVVKLTLPQPPISTNTVTSSDSSDDFPDITTTLMRFNSIFPRLCRTLHPPMDTAIITFHWIPKWAAIIISDLITKGETLLTENSAKEWNLINNLGLEPCHNPVCRSLNQYDYLLGPLWHWSVANHVPFPIYGPMRSVHLIIKSIVYIRQYEVEDMKEEQ